MVLDTDRELDLLNGELRISGRSRGSVDAGEQGLVRVERCALARAKVREHRLGDDQACLAQFNVTHQRRIDPVHCVHERFDAVKVRPAKVRAGRVKTPTPVRCDVRGVLDGEAGGLGADQRVRVHHDGQMLGRFMVVQGDAHTDVGYGSFEQAVLDHAHTE